MARVLYANRPGYASLFADFPDKTVYDAVPGAVTVANRRGIQYNNGRKSRALRRPGGRSVLGVFG